MKRIYLTLTLSAVYMASSLSMGNDPFSSGLLLSGSQTHCDSTLVPEDSLVLPESLLVRYMTTGMPQAIINREDEQDHLFFRIIPFTNSGGGIDYDPAETTACLELDIRLPAEDLPDLDPPVITGLYPPPGATEIPVRTGLWLTTSEPVKKDSGMIWLVTEDSLFAAIDILSEAVSISGDTVSVRLPELVRDKPYHVYLDSTCLADLNNNHPLWNDSTGKWFFHTITGDLYFSEYIEGEGYLKGIELFNPSSATLSLDEYRIHYSRNGAGLTGLYYFPQGIQLLPGQVFAVLHQAIADLDTFRLPAGCPADILTSTIVTFNGNDALGLEKTSDNGVSWDLIDLFGDPFSTIDFSVAGITSAAKDHSLLRKNFVRFGNTEWAGSAGNSLFNSEWKIYPVNYLSNLGYPSLPCDTSALISSYYFPGVTDSVNLLNDSNLIYVYLKPDIQADSLIPEIAIPEFSAIYPSRETPVPARQGQVNYTVTAEDRAHIRVWTIILQFPEPESFSTLRELKALWPAPQRVVYNNPALVTAVKDSLVFIQDTTAGIMVTGSDGRTAGISVGSRLTALSGQLTIHEGVICIYLLDDPAIIPGNAGLVSPAELLVQDILAGSDRYESVLIQIRNARFTTPGILFQEGQDYYVNQGSDTVTVAVDFFDTGLEGTSVPVFASVTGILIRTSGDLYIAPRFLADIEVQTDDFEFNPENTLIIVPNPGQGVFTITGHQLNGPARINVFNLAGQKIYESDFENIESVDVIVNLEGRPAGTYLLFMTVKDKIYISLLVKTE